MHYQHVCMWQAGNVRGLGDGLDYGVQQVAAQVGLSTFVAVGTLGGVTTQLTAWLIHREGVGAGQLCCSVAGYIWHGEGWLGRGRSGRRGWCSLVRSDRSCFFV